MTNTEPAALRPCGAWRVGRGQGPALAAREPRGLGPRPCLLVERCCVPGPPCTRSAPPSAPPRPSRPYWLARRPGAAPNGGPPGRWGGPCILRRGGPGGPPYQQPRALAVDRGGAARGPRPISAAGEQPPSRGVPLALVFLFFSFLFFSFFQVHVFRYTRFQVYTFSGVFPGRERARAGPPRGFGAFSYGFACAREKRIKSG